MADMQRDTGEASQPPGSEAARGNEPPADKVSDSPTVGTWRPGQDETGIRPVSPAAAAIAGTGAADAPAEPDDDAQSGRIPQPESKDTGPMTGADAPNHGGR